MVTIKLSSVTERDVDLLLLEQLATSRTFATNFLQAVKLGPGSEILEVAHSVQSPSGESDLEILVREGEHTHRVLIENKVDAQFQHQQAERYVARGQTYVKTGTALAARTVLVAPASYIQAHRDQHLFDAYVSLEQVGEWLGTADGNPMLSYKKALLELALKRAANGWTRVPDEAAIRFWQTYWELAEREAPQLQMPEPEGIPAGSTWIYFRPTLPKGVELIHKFVAGHVDLQFSGKGDSLDDLQITYGPHLDADMHVVRAHKSGAIRIRVPRCDFTAEIGTIETALHAAARLATLCTRTSNKG